MSLPVKQQYHHFLPNEITDFIQRHFDPGYDGYIWLGMRSHFVETINPKLKSKFKEMAAIPVSKMCNWLLEMHASDYCDYYISSNTFTSAKKRLFKTMFTINNIVIDIDCHDSEKLKDPKGQCQDMVHILKNELFCENVICWPNTIVYTGRGVQLWWTLDPQFIKRTGSKILEMYRWLIDTWTSVIAKTLRSHDGTCIFAVDTSSSTNAVGFFRLPFTRNFQAEADVVIEPIHDTRYDCYELCDKVYPDVLGIERRQYLENLTYRNTPIFAILGDDEEILAGINNPLAYKRIVAMMALREIRDADVGDETRDLYCWVVLNSLLFGKIDAEDALRRTLLFNARFKQPLRESELRTMMRTSIRRQGYSMTNAVIIDKLYISPEEQDAIQLFPAVEKAEKTHGAAKKAMKKEERIRKRGYAVALYQKGKNKCEIARLTGLTRPTVYKYIKEFLSGSLASEILSAAKLYLDQWKKHEKKRWGTKIDAPIRHYWCRKNDGMAQRKKYHIETKLHPEQGCKKSAPINRVFTMSNSAGSGAAGAQEVSQTWYGRAPVPSPS